MQKLISYLDSILNEPDDFWNSETLLISRTRKKSARHTLEFIKKTYAADLESLEISEKLTYSSFGDAMQMEIVMAVAE